MARRYPSYPSEIDDAVQEVFIELWKYAGRFDPAVASELAFVSMIARRRLIDLFRRRKTQPATDVLSESFAEPEFEIGNAAFAITEEPPGGVVVSERGRAGNFALVMTDAKP